MGGVRRAERAEDQAVPVTLHRGRLPTPYRLKVILTIKPGAFAHKDEKRTEARARRAAVTGLCEGS
ncbi:hypothetical protein GCM10019017_62880 [Streptomyces showdoensis]